MRRPRHAAFSLVLASLLAALLLAPSTSSGQAPAPKPAAPGGDAGADEPQGVFGETVEVRVVNLEVVVVDGAGHRVPGLSPRDLRLTVDGQPVAIDYFTEVAEGRAVAPGGATGAEGAPKAPQGAQPGGEVGTSYLVFIDESLTDVTRDRNIILKGLVEELPRLRPQDRMAVVAFAGVKPELLSGWSGSQAELRQVLEQAQRRRGHGNRARTGRDFLNTTETLGERPAPLPGINTIPLPPALDLAEAAPSTACLVVREYERNLQKVASAITATLRGFAAAPGRKVALLVSAGWPRSAKEYVLGSYNRRWPSGCRLLGPALWDPIHQTANQVGFTLYPVLAPDATRAVALEVDDAPVPFNPLGASSHLQETLDLLARETGGEAYARGARRELLARVAEDTRSYYWLGFTPTWKGDDRGHRVEVSAARPGLKVRSRAGFQDLSRRSEVTAQVEGALLFGDPPGALPLRVEVGPLPKGKRNEPARVKLRLTIPLDQVTMLPRGQQYLAELELRVALLDEDGNRNDIPVLPLRLAGAKPQPGQQAVYESELAVRRAKQELIVALFDPPTGKILEGRTAIVPN
jgi:VWFA-related protein